MNILHMYFSINGQTKKIADIFHHRLGGDFFDLTKPNIINNFPALDYDLTILNVPVYGNSFPETLRPILSKIKSPYLILNITYGGFSIGNILEDLTKNLSSTLIAYSITPVKHAYIDEFVQLNENAYQSMFAMIDSRIFLPVDIPKISRSFIEKKTAQFRTLHNIRLSINTTLCNNCGQCQNECPSQAIDEHMHINKSCLRCLRCVHLCKEKAITSKQSICLKWYLRKKRENLVKIYLGNSS